MIDPYRLFPYKTASEIQLRIEDIALRIPSGNNVSTKGRPLVTAQPGEYVLYADQELADWTFARVSVRAAAQEAVLRALLPKSKEVDLTADTVLLVSVACSSTKLRRRIILTKDADASGEWYGEFDLSAAQVSQAVELTPILARTRELPEEVKDDEGIPLATYRGAILAYGEPIRVRIAPPHERHGSFRVRWANFAQSQDEWLRGHQRDMFHIDTSDEQPEVVLNSAHELLKQTLMKRRPRGAEASVKAALIAYVAHSTWTSLFTAALASCSPSDGDQNQEEMTWPSDELKSKVLKRLLPLVIPGRTDDLDRLEAAVELYRDAARIATLMSQLNSAIQGLLKVDDFVVKTLELAEEAA